MSSLDSGSHLGRAADTIKKARWLEPLAMGSKFRIISHASTQSLHLHIYPGKKNSIYEANFLPIPYNRSRKATNWFQKSLIVKSQCTRKLLKSTTFSWDPMGRWHVRVQNPTFTNYCTRVNTTQILLGMRFTIARSCRSTHMLKGFLETSTEAVYEELSIHSFEWSFSRLPAHRPGPSCLPQVAIESWAEQDGKTTALL